MRNIFRAIGDFFKKADMILLSLCVTATIFGIVAAIYFIISYPLARLAKYLENRIGFTI